MTNLEKKNIIVTGASGGIGNAIIKKLSEAGANILAAEQWVAENKPQHPVVTILCDRSDKYSTKMFNKKFLEEKGLPFPNWL